MWQSCNINGLEMATKGFGHIQIGHTNIIKINRLINKICMATNNMMAIVANWLITFMAVYTQLFSHHLSLE